ncbi:MAG: folate-binding protein [Betaproteobacteria bacterium]
MDTQFTATSLITPNSSPLPSGIARLEHLGLIKVTGADNAAFLHGQLSNDFLNINAQSARLAAFCSAKGRMQASFVGCRRNNQDVLLVCSADLLAATLKRLSMFVMRAKAQLSDASGEFLVYGAIGDATRWLATGARAPWTAEQDGLTSRINLYPANQLARQLWISPAIEAAPAGPTLAADQWELSEVLSGVATVSAAVVDALVPQMLNFESVGGVSFKKGCYPGQEVVARSQFRGTLKRRAYVLECVSSPALAPGQEIYANLDPLQPCGLVVQSAPGRAGGGMCIASLQNSAVQLGGLRLGAPDGPVLTILPLPYPLAQDI